MAEDISSEENNYISSDFYITKPTSDLNGLFPEDKAARRTYYGAYFLIVLSGQAQVEIDGLEHNLSAKTIVCLTPNHLLFLVSQSNDFMVGHLFFEFDFMADFSLLIKADISEKMGSLPCLQLDESGFEPLKKYYEFILDRYTCARLPNRKEIIKGLLFSFIVELSYLYSLQPISMALSRGNEIVEHFFSLLHFHYKEQRTTGFYAERLCLTDKYLYRVIKRVTGHTFHFWVSDFRLREAKLLLRSTQMSTTEIAEKLHFSNSSVFSKFFKRYTGVTPMNFKKEMLNY